MSRELSAGIGWMGVFDKDEPDDDGSRLVVARAVAQLN
jgi:hypothetical protein